MKQATVWSFSACRRQGQRRAATALRESRYMVVGARTRTRHPEPLWSQYVSLEGDEDIKRKDIVSDL